MTDREPSRFSDTRKSDNITLPRAVGELVQDLVAHAYNDGVEELERPSEQTIQAAKALLDRFAALAEPEQQPEPVVVEQLFALAKLTVRRAADPDPWVWDRLADNGTWTPFNPLIHGPDMWRLEQALRAALAEPEKGNCADGSCNCCWTDKPDAKRKPATDEQIVESYTTSKYDGLLYDFHIAWREAERFHGITKEDGK